MMNTADYSNRTKLDKTAARWFIRMQDAVPDSPERAQFETWLTENEQHKIEYDSICDAWNGIDSIDELKKIAGARKIKRIKKKAAVLSAYLIFFIVGLIGHNQYQQWQTSPTMQMVSQSNTAQILTQTLDDGSQIILNANSKVQITYYRNQRQVTLLKGEVIFNVSKDSDRPFIVETNTTKVKVLGTRFAVNKLSKLVRVSVDHGKVQVESKNNPGVIILQNSQVAEIYNGQSVQQKDTDAADYFKFATSTVVFNQADIHEIADVLSRYLHTSVIAQGISQEKISAVFKAKDIETFINTLPKIANIEVLNTTDGAVILIGK